MRAFLGISVPDELKSRIEAIQDKFSDFDIKLVEKENLHFNLKFFGDIGDDDVEKLKRALEGVSKQFKPFEIDVSCIGAFPNINYVRVLWLGVRDGYKNLVELAEAIERSLESLGYGNKERFVPHLTLGRVRSGRNKEEMPKLLKELEDVSVGKMEIHQINLFQSILGPNGPTYEELFRIEFS
jgi:RNA 2',3'-cyclic 3'-phosphodiesterase